MTENNQTTQQTKLHELLDFPCDFPYKVIGGAKEELVYQVVSVVQKHLPGNYAPTINKSKTGKYFSVSIMVKVYNIEQVETLYKELSEIETVRMVL